MATISLFFLNRLSPYFFDFVRKRKLRNAFCKGAVPSPEGFVVERMELAAKVKRILQPQNGCSTYQIIAGNHGTGKTTLVRQVGHECSGIIYVQIPEDGLFEDAFAHAINRSPPMRFTWLLNTCARILGIGESGGGQKPRLSVPQ